MDFARPSVALAALVLATTAAAGLLGSATAQVDDYDCGPVSLASDAYERTISGDGDSASIQLDVSNDGALGGTAWVNATGAPGWTTAVEPASFELGAAETRQVDVVASPTSDVDAESSPYELALRAELDCTVGELGSAGSAAAEETIDLAIQGSSGGSGTQNGGGPLTGGPGLGYVLVGAVAVLSVVGYPVVRRRNRAAADLEAIHPIQSTNPREGISFTVGVTNTGGREGTVDLDLEGVPEGWSGFLARPRVDLEPGASTPVDVLLRPVDPDGAAREATVVLRALPEGRERGGDTVELTAHLTLAA